MLGTTSRSMSDTYGIEMIGPGLQPLVVLGLAYPGRCPGLGWAGALPLLDKPTATLDDESAEVLGNIKQLLNTGQIDA